MNGAVVILLCTVLISATLLVLRMAPEAWRASASPKGPPAAAPVARAPTTPPTTPVPTPTRKVKPREPDPESLLALPGRIPAHGDGTMRFATGRGPVLGTTGPLRRFRIAVERDSGEDLTEFVTQVEQTLGDERSWTGDGVRLQRVPKSEGSNFTVYLATRDTAQRMCMAGGVNLVVGGVPYTSCRTAGRVVVNLDRWRSSATPYRSARVPLRVYRHYVLNHEVGHELGYGHEGCPRQGGPAPVMVQQTLTLRGCKPYPWPHRGGKRFAGPRL